MKKTIAWQLVCICILLVCIQGMLCQMGLTMKEQRDTLERIDQRLDAAGYGIEEED